MKYPLHFLFNNQTKEFMMFSMDKRVTLGNALVHTIDFDERPNLANVGWEGDYDTGRMIYLTDQNAVVTETELEKKMYDRFYRKWSMERALFTVLFQLQEGRHQKIFGKEEPDFSEMMDYFIKVVRRFIKEVDHFEKSESHEFLNKVDEATKIKDRFAVK